MSTHTYPDMKGYVRIDDPDFVNADDLVYVRENQAFVIGGNMPIDIGDAIACGALIIYRPLPTVDDLLRELVELGCYEFAINTTHGGNSITAFTACLGQSNCSHDGDTALDALQGLLKMVKGEK